MNSKVVIFILLYFIFLNGKTGYVHAQTGNANLPATTADSSVLISSVEKVDTINMVVEEMINFAKTFMGTPYHYGGGTPSGFDCSGFINYVFGNFGFSLSRSSPGIAQFGKTISLSEIQPGDLMFFTGRNASSGSVGHVAMVVEVKDGNIKFIHASTTRGVTIDTFNGSKYYVPRYLKTKRLDYGGATPTKP